MPSASETVVPDSRVTGPMGNKMTPTTRATAATSNVTARANTTIEAYLTASRRVRPDGTASR